MDIPSASKRLRVVSSKKDIIFGHAIAHSPTWTKAVGVDQQKEDIQWFHREMRKRGIKVNK